MGQTNENMRTHMDAFEKIGKQVEEINKEAECAISVASFYGGTTLNLESDKRKNDLDKIDEDDRISVLGLPPVPDETVTCRITKPDGSTVDFECNHTFSPEQVDWFQAGSALNIIRQKSAG